MSEVLQAWIDRLYATSGQHWLLRAVSIAAAVGAVCTTAVASGRWWGFGVVLVVVLSVASALRPDLHTGAILIVVIWWNWIGTVEDVLTPWLLVVRMAVLVYHSSTALMAAVPPAATIPRATMMRWSTRTGLVAAATTGTWLVVVALDSRALRGHAGLTGLALAAIVAGALTVRVRSLVRR
jgi:hypothetical protein